MPGSVGVGSRQMEVEARDGDVAGRPMSEGSVSLSLGGNFRPAAAEGEGGGEVLHPSPPRAAGADGGPSFSFIAPALTDKE